MRDSPRDSDPDDAEKIANMLRGIDTELRSISSQFEDMNEYGVRDLNDNLSALSDVGVQIHEHSRVVGELRDEVEDLNETHERIADALEEIAED